MTFLSRLIGKYYTGFEKLWLFLKKTRIKFVTNVLQVILYLTVYIYLCRGGGGYHKANLQFFHILTNLILVVIVLDLSF